MKTLKGVGSLAAALTLTVGAAPVAFSQDAFPEPNTPAQEGSVADDAQIGTIEARDDGLGVDRDEPEKDMHGSGAIDEPISGDGTGPGFDPEQGPDGIDNERQEASDRASSDEASTGESSADDANADEASEEEAEPDPPGLDEPRQPIRPGQMEQLDDREE